jgi:hypothetical protein
MSPSGSLWERAESEPGDYQDTGQEPGGRPIYAWDPDRPSAPGYPPATQLSDGPGD